jgi:hypothetical protein
MDQNRLALQRPPAKLHVAHVTAKQLDSAAQIGGKIAVVSVNLRAEIVEDGDFMTQGQQPARQAGADETRAACNEYALLRGPRAFVFSFRKRAAIFHEKSPDKNARQSRFTNKFTPRAEKQGEGQLTVQGNRI